MLHLKLHWALLPLCRKSKRLGMVAHFCSILCGFFYNNILLQIFFDTHPLSFIHISPLNFFSFIFTFRLAWDKDGWNNVEERNTHLCSSLVLSCSPLKKERKRIRELFISILFSIFSFFTSTQSLYPRSSACTFAVNPSIEF